MTPPDLRVHALELGSLRAPGREAAYQQSLERIRATEPYLTLFAHDRRNAGTGARDAGVAKRSRSPVQSKPR